MILNASEGQLSCKVPSQVDAGLHIIGLSKVDRELGPTLPVQNCSERDTFERDGAKNRGDVRALG